MDRKLIAILVGGALVMAVTVWVTSPGPLPPLKLEDRSFMHCPKCSREMPYRPEKADKGCLQCGYEGSLTPTKQSLAKSGPPPNRFTAMWASLLLEANMLLAAVLGYTVWSRRKLSEEEFLYTECGRCSQKLRYRAEKVGAAGQCPRCKRSLVFPTPDLDDEELHWWQPAKWQRVLNKQWVRLREKTRGRFARNLSSQPEDQEQ